MSAYVLLLLPMTLMGAAGSLFLKKASGAEDLRALVKNAHLYLGAGLYFLSAVLNILILRRLDYSVVLPLTSLTYVWTMLLSQRVLKEKITARKIAGLLLILLGAVCVSANIS